MALWGLTKVIIVPVSMDINLQVARVALLLRASVVVLQCIAFRLGCLRFDRSAGWSSSGDPLGAWRVRVSRGRSSNSASDNATNNISDT